ncbi:MAG: [NiFe]-hydrogenase assembly chaperone HybE [Gammaproteobacteria bacterium]|nr:[NiFe]-hydrogenase assembly chaperone HybE [Gammaproteobacteria bacterium]
MSNGTAVVVFYKSVARKMAGLPVYNNKLAVDATEFLSWEDNWFGIIVTPWCMNIVLLPGEASHHNAQQVGAKFRHKLPSGLYEFIRAYAGDCGDFATCSVFSPMFEFSSQNIAMETAKEVLAALFDAENVSPSERHQSYTVYSEMRQAVELEAQAGDTESGKQEAVEEAPELSRRAFLSGSFARREGNRP